jgi:hypothetical protein
MFIDGWVRHRHGNQDGLDLWTHPRGARVMLQCLASTRPGVLIVARQLQVVRPLSNSLPIIHYYAANGHGRWHRHGLERIQGQDRALHMLGDPWPRGQRLGPRTVGCVYGAAWASTAWLTRLCAFVLLSKGSEGLRSLPAGRRAPQLTGGFGYCFSSRQFRFHGGTPPVRGPISGKPYLAVNRALHHPLAYRP